MTQPNGQHPPQYTLPADLVANIYQLLAQVASGQAARVFVALEDAIGKQTLEYQRASVVAEPVNQERDGKDEGEFEVEKSNV